MSSKSGNKTQHTTTTMTIMRMILVMIVVMITAMQATILIVRESQLYSSAVDLG